MWWYINIGKISSAIQYFQLLGLVVYLPGGRKSQDKLHPCKLLLSSHLKCCFDIGLEAVVHVGWLVGLHDEASTGLIWMDKLELYSLFFIRIRGRNILILFPAAEHAAWMLSEGSIGLIVIVHFSTSPVLLSIDINLLRQWIGTWWKVNLLIESVSFVVILWEGEVLQ